MIRTTQKYTLANPRLFKRQLLQWAEIQQTSLWLDSNDYPQKYSSFDSALALGVVSEITTDFKNAFKKLDVFQQKTKDYIFGYLSYDLKNDVEKLISNNHDELDFPDLYFFQPQKLFFFKGREVEIQYLTSCKDDIAIDYKHITKIVITKEKTNNSLHVQQRVSEAAYYQKIKQVQAHITRGDSYETNFCMEYFAENADLNPLTAFHNLNTISQAPFATLFKHKKHYILSASPERFVRKEGQKLISQPIKGTAKRSHDIKEDQILVQQLQNDPKERAENIMIVDLVRNDLSKTASKASVKVEELCKVYSFKQVHQLISTIVSKVKKDISPVQIIKSLFPMGSMTGAPKISTMQIIEDLEESKRSVYSGAIGYFTPSGDFDFNVVIRSILYNQQKKYISYSVGGAITAKSISTNEYVECQTKAAAMKQVLTGG